MRCECCGRLFESTAQDDEEECCTKADVDFSKALWHKDLEGLKKAISDGANVNLDCDGTPSFFDALSISNVEFLRICIDAGADVNLRDEHGNTPLHIVSEGSRVEAVELLIKKGAEVNVKNNDGETPLSIAIAGFNDYDGENSRKVADVLVRSGADYAEAVLSEFKVTKDDLSMTLDFYAAGDNAAMDLVEEKENGDEWIPKRSINAAIKEMKKSMLAIGKGKTKELGGACILFAASDIKVSNEDTIDKVIPSIVESIAEEKGIDIDKIQGLRKKAMDSVLDNIRKLFSDTDAVEEIAEEVKDGMNDCRENNF